MTCLIRHSFSGRKSAEGSKKKVNIFNNYWMRLSIMQIEEGVIRQSRRLRQMTPSEICGKILPIIRKPNSIIVLLFIQNSSRALRRTKLLY